MDYPCHLHDSRKQREEKKQAGVIVNDKGTMKASISTALEKETKTRQENTMTFRVYLQRIVLAAYIEALSVITAAPWSAFQVYSSDFGALLVLFFCMRTNGFMD